MPLQYLIENRDAVYHLTYFLAVAVRAWIFFHDCRRRNYPLSHASAVMLFSFMCFVLGTRLMSMGPEEWKALFSGAEIPDMQGRTALGGLLFGYVGFVLGARLFRAPVLGPDMLVVAAPLALGIQRLGCLAAGCCFGDLSSEFGLSYPACTPAGHHQMHLGLIPGNASHTLSVFPVQLMIAVGCFLIAGGMFYLRRKNLLKRGNFMLALSAYLILAFVTDFFRTGYNNPRFGTMYAGLKLVQWVELLIGLSLLLLYFRLPVRPPKPAVFGRTDSVRYALLLVPGLFILFCQEWFSRAELASLALSWAAFLIFNLQALHESSFRIYRFAAVSSVIMAVVLARPLFAQLKLHKAAYPDSGEHSYHQIGIGAGTEVFSHYHDARFVSSNCGNSYTGAGPRYRHTTTLGGINYQHVKTTDLYRRFILGGGLGFGYDREEALDTIYPHKTLNTWIPPVYRNTGGGNAYFQWDSEWLGFGAGAFAGQFFRQDSMVGNVQVGRGDPQLRVGLNYNFRLGYCRTFYVYAKSSHSLVNSFNFRDPLGNHEVGVGTGLGLRNGTAFNFGMQIVSGETTPFIDLTYIHRNMGGLQFRTTRRDYNGSSVQFGVFYRLGHK